MERRTFTFLVRMKPRRESSLHTSRWHGLVGYSGINQVAVSACASAAVALCGCSQRCDEEKSCDRENGGIS